MSGVKENVWRKRLIATMHLEDLLILHVQK